MLSTQELTELKARCITAASRGFSIGKAESYVAQLQEVVGKPELPAGMAPLSPAHLLHLIGMAERGEKATPTMRSAKPIEAPKPAPEPEPEPEIAVEAPPAPPSSAGDEPAKPRKRGR